MAGSCQVEAGSIEHGAAEYCNGGNIVRSGAYCVARCEAGYQPSERILPCIDGAWVVANVTSLNEHAIFACVSSRLASGTTEERQSLHSNTTMKRLSSWAAAAQSDLASLGAAATSKFSDMGTAATSELGAVESTVVTKVAQTRESESDTTVQVSVWIGIFVVFFALGSMLWLCLRFWVCRKASNKGSRIRSLHLVPDALDDETDDDDSEQGDFSATQWQPAKASELWHPPAHTDEVTAPLRLHISQGCRGVPLPTATHDALGECKQQEEEQHSRSAAHERILSACIRRGVNAYQHPGMQFGVAHEKARLSASLQAVHSTHSGARAHSVVPWSDVRVNE